MRARPLTKLIQIFVVGTLTVLVGCATDVEVKKARATLESARTAGKATQCPADFKAVEDMVTQAEGMCTNCKYEQADMLAAAAVAKANALCPPPKPTPPPAEVRTVQAPPAAPTASIAVGPSSVDSGGCANLTWATAGATDVSIDSGVGSVGASGSKQVCPTSTTKYTVTANGPGGSSTGSTTLTVNEKGAAPAPGPKPTDKMTIHVNFDTNKSDIRKSDLDDLQKAEAFVKKYSTCKIEIDGYTDSTGGPKINQPLSERRADAVKKWLLDHGATSGDQITTKGYGASNPIADNKTAKGRAQNRRAEILAFCQ
jgi:outer membrane protein OmpA-like peptidoglycan-associated protein